MLNGLLLDGGVAYRDIKHLHFDASNLRNALSAHKSIGMCENDSRSVKVKFPFKYDTAATDQIRPIEAIGVLDKIEE